ncbi:MAG: translation initiation factor [Lewinella sp.]|nr:translation initiation factor [Lewinella sp.]
MPKKSRSGVVYSTNPDFDYDNPFALLGGLSSSLAGDAEEETEMAEETPAPSSQVLRLFLDRKQRKGKEVTIVNGFVGSEQALAELGKFLKTKCGVGGAVKDGEIIIQGNQRDKILALLLEAGYQKTKCAGGEPPDFSPAMVLYCFFTRSWLALALSVLAHDQGANWLPPLNTRA